MFKVLDIIKLTVAVLYTIIVSVLLAYDVEIDPSIQDYAIVLTHLTAIPLVILIWDTQWIAWTILIGVLVSVLFHVTLVFEWYVERTEPMDICFANLTLILVTIVIIFEKIPEWTLPILFTVNAINTTFWDTLWVYTSLSALNNILLISYIIYRLCYPSNERNTTFLVIALTIGTTGSVFFLSDGGHNGEHYGIVHSVWHVCSYTALYFALRSLNTKTDTLRHERVEFDVNFINKIAYH
tara:strand:+ start:3915 stop:4631 length:717 start_codon:yes stop_codon:yes gene_type:complete